MKKGELFDQKVDLYKTSLNEMVVKYVGVGQRILDVGCCEGGLGKHLRKYKKAKVFGIDISPKAIKKAKRNLDGAYLLNIETDDLPFPRNSFDIIIGADILEHLYDPLAVLKKLKPYLKNKGVFILSIPNIANISIRWDLLWGRFDYQKEGIMDETHLRFFTEKTVRGLIKEAGLKLIKIDYFPGYHFFFLQGRIMKWRLFKRLQYWLTRLAPRLFCSQFIVVAGR